MDSQPQQSKGLKMTNEIFEKAKRIHAQMALRIWVGDISFSTNRYGQYSAYFDTASGTIRISDHGCNSDFRVDTIDWSTEDAAFIDAWCDDLTIAGNKAALNSAARRFAAALNNAKRQADVNQEKDMFKRNQQALLDAGYDLEKLTKNTRKKALKDLRKKGVIA